MGRTITLQPRGTGSVLPYPFHVTESGEVLRQDWWKGDPERVLGFVPRPESHDMTPWADYLADPERAVGAYVVTEDATGGWSTHLPEIIAVTENTREEASP